jgi:hypothetical protein
VASTIHNPVDKAVFNQELKKAVSSIEPQKTEDKESALDTEIANAEINVISKIKKF